MLLNFFAKLGDGCCPLFLNLPTVERIKSVIRAHLLFCILSSLLLFAVGRMYNSSNLLFTLHSFFFSLSHSSSSIVSLFIFFALFYLFRTLLPLHLSLLIYDDTLFFFFFFYLRAVVRNTKCKSTASEGVHCDSAGFVLPVQVAKK